MAEQTSEQAGRRPRFRRAASEAAPAQRPPSPEIADFRNQLTNSVLAPLHLMMLTRERIQEVMDDAVNRGRMTRDDANEIVQGLVRRGRHETDEVLADLERLLGRGMDELGGATTGARQRATRAAQAARGQVEDAAGRTRGQTRRVAQTAMAQAERARSIDRGFPIAGYDDLGTRQVQGRLEGLGPAELRRVRDYERRNANRKSVIKALDKRLG